MKRYIVSLIWEGRTIAPFRGIIVANSAEEALDQALEIKVCKDRILKGYTLVMQDVEVLDCLENMDYSVGWVEDLGVVAIKLNTLNLEQFNAFVSFLNVMKLIDSERTINKIKEIYKAQLEIDTVI